MKYLIRSTGRMSAVRCGSWVCGSPLIRQTEDDVRKVKLASHNAVIEGNAYRVRYEADIQDAAKAAMDNGLDVSYASFVSNWDAATETQQLENSINEGYDILLVNPVAPTGLDPIIEKALDADIIYINCDCEYYADQYSKRSHRPILPRLQDRHLCR